MKKYPIITILLFLSIFLCPNKVLSSSGLINRVSGYILLQVEENGEAWYVNPADSQRYYMKDGEAAQQIMRSFGIGILNDDLKKIPIGLLPQGSVDVDNDIDGLINNLEVSLGTDINRMDSDNDGINDGLEIKAGSDPLGHGMLPINKTFTNNLKGKILLQVQAHGEAWYVNPKDGKRYYLSTNYESYQAMRYLSLGITNEDLSKIPIGNLVEVNNDDKNLANLISSDYAKDEVMFFLNKTYRPTMGMVNFVGIASKDDLYIIKISYRTPLEEEDCGITKDGVYFFHNVTNIEDSINEVRNILHMSPIDKDNTNIKDYGRKLSEAEARERIIYYVNETYVPIYKDNFYFVNIKKINSFYKATILKEHLEPGHSGYDEIYMSLDGELILSVPIDINKFLTEYSDFYSSIY